MKHQDILADCVISQAPRLLTSLDRNITSNTYGCFDRTYWQYKTVDFPGARSQEAALTLALLYTSKTKPNPYHGNELVKEWIRAALEFWCAIQERGTFNEWYPHERSFVATAFTTYAISETLLVLPELRTPRLLACLKASGDWLLRHDERRVFNQESGCVAALYNLFLLTDDTRYRQGAERKVGFIVGHQNEEGWWYEYEGPDIGYLSLMIDYLSKYYKKSGDVRVRDALKRAIRFISFFVHPDGTAGGEYASRNTEYLIPGGFFRMARESEDAAAIARSITENIAKGQGIFPATLDDRYLTYISYNWLQAALEPAPSAAGRLPCNIGEVSAEFPAAGIAVRGTPAFYLIANGKKGGAFMLFSKKAKLKMVETGIVLLTRNGPYSNGRISAGNALSIEGDTVRVDAKFFRVTSHRMDSRKLLAIRAFQNTLGRSETLARLVKSKLRDMLISKRTEGVGQLKREITIGDSVRIVDTVTLVPGTSEVVLNSKFAELYVPSSQYFQTPELQNERIRIPVTGKDITIVRSIGSDGRVTVTDNR
ncbi:hypothetical protein HY493_03295 [Candidatus Woesearchaeota archaeon]|nr:hypothetical protein [Candidatus Woesearchaeota archaeon]